MAKSAAAVATTAAGATTCDGSGVGNGSNMRSSRSDSGRTYPGHASKAIAQQARGEGLAATDEGGGYGGDDVEPREGLGGQREAGGGAAERGAGQWDAARCDDGGANEQRWVDGG